MKRAGWMAGRLTGWVAWVWLLSLSLLPSVLPAAEPASVELIPPKDSAPWVGQRTVFAVEVAVEGRFSSSTLFDLPQVAGAILMKPEERPVLSTRTVDDREYSVQRHEFSLFCQQGGEITVPEIHVRCASIKSFGEPPTQHTLRVQALKVTPRMPGGARPGQVVVTTTRLDVNETWNPRPGEAKVGDAFRRTVTIRGSDVPGMLLPRIPKPQIEGLAIYPAAPWVNDRTERGEFTGERVETLTYLCEQAATVEIPPVLYRWWNPSKSSWEERTLEAMILTISPNPAYAPKDSDGPSSEGQEGQEAYLWWVLVLALIALGSLFLLRRRKPDEEAQAFREVLRACRNNDAADAYNAVTRWRSLTTTFAGPSTAEVTKELVSAQRMIVRLESAWNGRKLEKSMVSWRRRARQGKTPLPTAGKLPELNPTG